jgi:hypothetical protein
MEASTSNGHLAISHADAEEFTAALGQVLGGAVRLAEWAPGVGIPDALGLSPSEWAERRLAGHVRLSIEERRQVVAANPDMSVRELGEALGVGHATIARDKKALAPVPDGTPEPEEATDSAESTLAPVPDGTPEPEPEPEPSPVKSMDVHFSSQTDEWSTPQDFFNIIDDEFHFDLDACALDSSAKCPNYFTPDRTGSRRNGPAPSG